MMAYKVVGPRKTAHINRMGVVYRVILEKSSIKNAEIIEKCAKLYGYSRKQTQKCILELLSNGQIGQCVYCYSYYPKFQGNKTRYCISCILNILSEDRTV